MKPRPADGSSSSSEGGEGKEAGFDVPSQEDSKLQRRRPTEPCRAGDRSGRHQEPWACLWPRGSRSVRSCVWLEGLNVAI